MFCSIYFHELQIKGPKIHPKTKLPNILLLAYTGYTAKLYLYWLYCQAYTGYTWLYCQAVIEKNVILLWWEKKP